MAESLRDTVTNIIVGPGAMCRMSEAEAQCIADDILAVVVSPIGIHRDQIVWTNDGRIAAILPPE